MRNIRSSLLFTLLLAGTALSPLAARAASMPSHPVAGPGWSLSPYSPCVRDSVTLIVMGFASTPCDSFIGVDKLGALHVRIRTMVRDGYRCFAPPIYFPIRVPLGQFPPGPYTLDLENQVVYVAQDGTTHTDITHAPVNFYVTPDCPPIPGPLPYVGAIFTDPMLPCPEKPTTLVLEGAFRDGCGQVIDSSPPGSGNVELTLKVAAGPDTVCTLALKPWRVEFPLGWLSSGNHRVAITLHVVDRDSIGTGFDRRTYYGAHEFFVGGRCDSIPPPPGPLPFVSFIDIGPLRTPWNVCESTICPMDSIQVVVGGEFPDDCHQFRGIQLIPSPIASPLPQPPVVRIIVDVSGCQRRLCRDVQVPWAAFATLPPLPPRDYQLMVELAQVSCSDSFPPGQLFRTRAPFTVADSCRVPPACLTTSFAPGRGNLTACNATVAPGQPAELTFLVRPSVALAGLQGEFRLGPPRLRITKLEPIGPAAGMLLNWSATADGARFVLFAEHGAPIPPLPPPDASGAVYPAAWPVLRVTVEQPAGIDAPEFTVVDATNLLGSDIDGRGVPLCLPPPCVYGPAYPPPIGGGFDPALNHAIICAEGACDFNADGLEDIRDLVLMVHCVNGEGACPPAAGIHFDCDQDSTLSIADVLCCARHILRRPPCPDCPPDTSGVRPEPGVAVSFGVPVETSSGVDLPLRIDGADRLGAAMLTLDAPLDRYDVAGIEAPVGLWLALHELRDGRLILGLVSTWSGDFAVNPTLDLTLHLALKPGQSPGGEVSAVAGEFSGPDGAMLAVTLGTPSRELPGPARLALGGNRPNPFSSETRFTLELVEGAEVVVGIYDLRGRAVATLFRGHLPSGPQEFRWDGRSADGTAAANGVYFYRVVVGAKALTHKLILMRGD